MLTTVKYIHTSSFNVCITFVCLVIAEIIAEVTDMLENETNPLTFSCQAIGEPVPTISWYFNAIPVNLSDASKYNTFSSINGIVVTSLLTIMNTQPLDVGTYTCEAENFIGTVRSSGTLTIHGEYTCVLLNRACTGHTHLISRDYVSSTYVSVCLCIHFQGH